MRELKDAVDFFCLLVFIFPNGHKVRQLGAVIKQEHFNWSPPEKMKEAIM